MTERNSNLDTSHNWSRTETVTHPSTNIAHCRLTSVSRQIVDTSNSVAFDVFNNPSNFVYVCDNDVPNVLDVLDVSNVKTLIKNVKV